ADMLSVWEELCKPWLDEKYPGQDMTEKILAELDAIRVKVHGK
ncbi:MAG TPA: ABC transporter substrate-binding protein, partial [Synergistetes bacterium]|nr:ABC transporter substrate-binding protein [Synergistota bacterium]